MIKGYVGYERHFARVRTGTTVGTPRPDDLIWSWLPHEKHSRILDIGCGWGTRLSLLKTFGFTHLHGIDMHPEIISTASRSVSAEIKLTCGTAEEFLTRSTDLYDRILFFHVIEHFSVCEVIELLALARARLNPAGLIVVEVPNMACLTSCLTFFSDLTHKTGFTEYSLAQAFDEAGLPEHNVLCYGTTRRLLSRAIRGSGSTVLLNKIVHRGIHALTRTGPRPTCVCPALLMTAGR